MRARSFFYVCAGLFLLAGAYAMGARSAGAGVDQIQGASLVFTGQGPATFRASAVKNGTLYWMAEDGSGQPIGDPVPAGNVLATDPENIGVLMENGDVLSSASGSWTAVGNLFGAPVPARHESWGQLKTRYR